MKHQEEPPLLECAFLFPSPHRTLEYQRFRFGNLPLRRHDRVPPEPFQRANPLEPVHDDEPARFAREANDHDRRLLPVLRQ
jgi:hypothetical protein